MGRIIGIQLPRKKYFWFVNFRFLQILQLDITCIRDEIIYRYYLCSSCRTREGLPYFRAINTYTKNPIYRWNEYKTHLDYQSYGVNSKAIIHLRRQEIAFDNFTMKERAKIFAGELIFLVKRKMIKCLHQKKLCQGKEIKRFVYI